MLSNQSRLGSTITLSILSLFTAATIACSSSSPSPSAQEEGASTNPSSSKTGSSSSSSGSTSSTSSSSDTDGGGDTTDTDSGTTADCSKTTDGDSCFSCCYAIDQTDYDAAGAAYDACQCAASACASACSTTYCSATPADPNDACETCLEQNDATCETKFDAACTSPGCMQVTSCLDTNCSKYQSGM